MNTTTKILHLRSRSVGKDCTLNIETFILIEIEINGLALIGELACGAETIGRNH
jgi:hypothetical protein